MIAICMSHRTYIFQALAQYSHVQIVPDLDQKDRNQILVRLQR
jgi:hypothetical protein